MRCSCRIYGERCDADIKYVYFNKTEKLIYGVCKRCEIKYVNKSFYQRNDIRITMEEAIIISVMEDIRAV